MMYEGLVLLVDDQPKASEASIAALEHYVPRERVLYAEDVETAKKILGAGNVSLVFLDIEMPGMNGIETFEHMKGRYDDIPVIFLTASGYEEDVKSAIRLGAVNYLKKPFLPQELLNRIAKEFEMK